MPVRVLLADDHVIVRQGLHSILEKEGFIVVGEAADGREAVRLGATHHPEVAVMDLSMPLLNGIDAAREIIKSNPRTKVVLLTMHTEDHLVLASLRAGVRGYVLKNNAYQELIDAIRSVCRGDIFLTPSISRTVVEVFLQNHDDEDASTGRLSDRERQVVQLIAEGKTTKEIAGLLGISVRTAESHRSNLMERLNIHETAGLVRYAIRNGLIEL